MDLNALLTLYQNHPNVLDIVKKINTNQITDNIFYLNGLNGDAYYFYLSAIIKNSHYKTIVVIQNNSEQIFVANSFFLKSLPEFSINVLPNSFDKKNILKTSSQNLILRTIALNDIATFEKKTISICDIEALSEKVLNTENFKTQIILIDKNQNLYFDELFTNLHQLGFYQVDFVYQTGQYSVRGGIIDIFSFNNDQPYRIEMDGDKIESIRIFNPETQLSTEQISQFNIIGQAQNDDKDFNSFFEFIPTQTLFIIEDFTNLNYKLEKLKEQILNPQKNAYHKIEFIENESESMAPIQFINFENIQNYLQHFVQIQKMSFTNPEKTSHYLFNFKTQVQHSYNREYKIMTDDFYKWQNEAYKIFISANNQKQFDRVKNICEQYHFNLSLQFLDYTLHEGFIDQDLKLICFTDHQIFQRYKQLDQKKIKSQEDILTIKSLYTINEGDFLTHIDYGVGRFSGLQKLQIGNTTQEVVRMIYKDNDVLYVNINALYKLSKYSSKDGAEPTIHKIGSDVWAKIKIKAKAKIKVLAFDLIKLYAARKSNKGFAYNEDNFLMHELEASFIYEDTPDQHKANLEIKTDMQAEAPMDRLICGDVGFGKTELAIRAAFKACCDDKQVVVLVPTTVLAFQHHHNFAERLKNMPVKIDFLNRFRTAKEKTNILQQLENGDINIIIGTHTLLNKKVKFKNLGLIIVDEEQKFGVNAKETLKSHFSNIDCLTLSATPIPRTLQFSLMGARDLSIIQTPPPSRQKVDTEIHLFNIDFIKEQIYKEMDRGGQVFFIHNRVQNLGELVAMVKSVCPELSIATAHGQMDGDDLENIIVDFIAKKYDILMATNIIENGIDISNVNTIFINNAHHFGLSDLHQLRGRVGRSNIKSFCYMLVPSKDLLNTEAKKKLQTISQYSELGSGFHIAMKDLDLRGAGNILGAEQSGFITNIGFDAYQKILNETIRELKQNDFKDTFKFQTQGVSFVEDCAVETDLEIFIPDDYIHSSSERLAYYTKINNSKNDNELDNIKKEIVDRFGKYPEQVQKLFLIVQIRRIGLKLSFEKITYKNKSLRCYFINTHDSPYFESEVFKHILNYIQTQTNKVTLKQSPKSISLIYEKLNNLNEVIDELQKMNREKK